MRRLKKTTTRQGVRSGTQITETISQPRAPRSLIVSRCGLRGSPTRPFSRSRSAQVYSQRSAITAPAFGVKLALSHSNRTNLALVRVLPRKMVHDSPR